MGLLGEYQEQRTGLRGTAGTAAAAEIKGGREPPLYHSGWGNGQEAEALGEKCKGQPCSQGQGEEGP